MNTAVVSIRCFDVAPTALSCLLQKIGPQHRCFAMKALDRTLLQVLKQQVRGVD